MPRPAWGSGSGAGVESVLTRSLAQETTPERRMNAGAGRLEAMVEWRKGGASKASPRDSGGKETRGERRRRQTARRLDFARPSDAPPSD